MGKVSRMLRTSNPIEIVLTRTHRNGLLARRHSRIPQVRSQTRMARVVTQRVGRHCESPKTNG